MSYVITSLFIDVHPSNVKITVFRHRNCIITASTVNKYSLGQLLSRVVADGRRWSLHNGLYHHHSSAFDIVFCGILAETNPNMKSRFHVSWWDLEVSYFIAASMECYVCQLSYYGSNLNVQYEFPLWTYNSNSSTSLSPQHGPSCFIGHWTGQFGIFRLCSFVSICDVRLCQ